MTTLRAGLIGQHISRTRLPKALQIMCDAAGWALDFTLFDTAELPVFDFTETLEQARRDGWTGMTVTHPFKTQARRFAGSGMTAQTAHLGACNTLAFGPRLTGYNTDYTGFLSVLDSAGLKALGDTVMMGAGGVAEALGPAIASRLSTGKALWISDTNPARATALAGRIVGARVLNPGDSETTIRNASGVINATPLGMAEYPGSVFDPALIGAQDWAFDAVYTPTDTQFLQNAAQAGLMCLTGFDLFRAMAVRSFAAYTGLNVSMGEIGPALDALRPD